MTTYANWTNDVRAMMAGLGFPAYGSPDWTVTTWPPQFSDGHAGEPALRLSNAAYAQAFNANLLPDAGTHSSGSGSDVYVLAAAMTGDTDVVATSPHVMTPVERAANAAFSGLDTAANAIGLPSLSSIDSFIKGIGRDVFVGVAVTLAVAYFVNNRKRR